MNQNKNYKYMNNKMLNKKIKIFKIYYNKINHIIKKK